MINETIIEKIYLNNKNLRNSISEFKHKRYLFKELNKLIKERKEFIGYFGLRGIGKTVLLLQLAEKFENSIYISVDATYLSNTSLYELINHFYNQGINYFFIDEIHFKKDWTVDLKTLFDEKKDLKIIFTGSSSLNLKKGVDLSRRVIFREINPVSFREFLNIKKGKNHKPIKLNEILKNKNELISRLFESNQYLAEYYKKGGLLIDYEESIVDNILRKMITEDLGYLKKINIKIENDIYKILNKVAASLPYETNYSNISSYIENNKNTTISLIKDLEKISLINILLSKKDKSEPKFFLPVPFRSFLCATFGIDVNIGSLREDFVVMHLKPDHYVKSDYRRKNPDFIKDNFSFEVGGKNKSKKQKADFRIIDGVSTDDNKIPLLLLGFLY